jgi:hypothetical protein
MSIYLFWGGGGVKDPTADATDATQPWGLLCNPVMDIKMMSSCFNFSK